LLISKLMITTFRVTRMTRSCTLPASESSIVCLYERILVIGQISNENFGWN
jgi:hypothetical protein